MNSFSELSLIPTLAPGLDAMGFSVMTPIQSQSLPGILAGRDLLAQAPTGSGKTGAFGIGLLQRLDPALQRAQALVLCPTRELADQVGKQIRRLATGIPNLKISILTGGTPIGPQLNSLHTQDPHVVVGTPGRVQDLLRKKALHLGGVRTLVLDEADRMLDMGFEEALTEIVGRCPKDRQSLLFSATYSAESRALCMAMLRDPLEIAIDAVDKPGVIDQQFYEVDLPLKQKALAGLLLRENLDQVVVFCNLRTDVDDVARSLRQFGFSAAALHGDMEQRDRDEILVRFSNRSCNVLVASDVAARGLDVVSLPAVINYELPQDPEIYVHRIGRTGRAGQDGRALSLVAPRERGRAQALEARAQAPLRWSRPPLADHRPANLPLAPMVTLRIDAGKVSKLRPGDILGALTGVAGLAADAVGKIDIFPTRSYVAVRRDVANVALARLTEGRIKGRHFRVVKA